MVNFLHTLLPTLFRLMVKKRFYWTGILTLLVLIGSYGKALSMNPGYTSFEELYNQNMLIKAEEAVGRKIGDYTLIDQEGRYFNLNSLLDKPLIISMVYATCDYACPTITMHLKRVVEEAGKDFGGKFRLLTVSFDPNDTAQVMKDFGKSFAGDFKNWLFATGDKEAIVNLARNVGLTYVKSGIEDLYKYQHLNLVTIVDTKGKIYKQLYGVDLKPKAVLKYIDMSIEQRQLWVRLLNIFDTIKSLCYTYDAQGRYVPNFAVLIPIFLGLIIQIILVFFFVYILRSSRETKTSFKNQRLS